MKYLHQILFLLLVTGIAHGQGTRNISGRVFDEELEPIPYAVLFDQDSAILITSDLEGHFEFETASDSLSLNLMFLGHEPTQIIITEECYNLEVIMMYSRTYCFMSMNKADRLRHKRFKQSQKIHQDAYNQGIFKSESPCFKYRHEKKPGVYVVL